MQTFFVYVFADSALEKEYAFTLVDQARRLIDLLGRPGIEAKRGQNNGNFQKNGFLKFPFRNRKKARQYQELIKQFCPCSIMTRRTRSK